jgi:hypothetical protein
MRGRLYVHATRDDYIKWLAQAYRLQTTRQP